MRGRIIGAAIALLLTREAWAQYAVFDSSNFAQLVKQAKTLGEQMKKLEATYQALSGVRGFGDILYNRELRKYLPADWMHVYDDAMGAGYAGISGTLKAIHEAEELKGTVDEGLGKVIGRSRAKEITDKAIGLQAFKGAEERLKQIESLMDRINQTKDMKGIQELQARIGVEQAAVANEATKLKLVEILQQAEERLIELQKSDLARKILSPSNTGMPECCSSKLESP